MDFIDFAFLLYLLNNCIFVKNLSAIAYGIIRV